jgi:hypothetical protein
MYYMSKLSRLLLTALSLILAPVIQAQPLEVSVSGNKASAQINLPGNISADITLSFEQVVGLTPDNLGLSAELIDITDLSLAHRLPSLLNKVPAAFPMMLTIEPPSNGGLSFSGVVTLDIHTHNLEYTANTPLRLFKAPLGGTFEDITATTGAGSYRARGTTGKFSQFIIAADLRSALKVANGKFSRLKTELHNAQSGIEPELYAQLAGQLDNIGSLIDSRLYSQASTDLSRWSQLIEQNAGAHIPNVWRSSRDIANVAGELLARVNSLRYTLHLIK